MDIVVNRMKYDRRAVEIYLSNISCQEEESEK